MRKYLIVHVIHEFIMGGAERGLFNFLANTTDTKFKHCVVAFVDNKMRKDFMQLGLDTLIVPRRHTFDQNCWRALRKCFLNCSMVHCRNSTSAVTFGGLAAYLSGVPFVTSVHGHGMFSESGVKISLWYAMHRAAKKTITVSESIARAMELKGHSRSKLRVILNGLDMSAYNGFQLTQEERYRLREDLIKGDCGPLIGCVGSLREVKGQRFLLSAFKKVLSVIPSARLLISGEGPDLRTLQEMSTALGLDNSVQFLGFRNDAFALIQCLDVLVVPSVSEGLSNVILEAMTFNTPIVATAVGGTPEIIVDGVHGLLVDYGNEERLATAIIDILHNQEMRATFVANSRELIARKFSLSRMVSEYEDVYRDVCSSAGCRRFP